MSRSCFSRSSTRQPSKSGSEMSSVMASGWRSRASASAAAPNAVVKTLYPWSCARSAITPEKAWSLSTTSSTRSWGPTMSRSSTSGADSARSASTGSSIGDRRGGRRDRLGCLGAGLAAARLRVRLRQVQRERAALVGRADQRQLAAKQARQFAADRQAEARAAVLAARAAIGLLEGLEDDLLLFRRDSDARVANRDGQHRPGPIERVVALAPAAACAADRQLHGSASRELEGVRKQVLQHLLQPLRVGLETSWTAAARCRSRTRDAAPRRRGGTCDRRSAGAARGCSPRCPPPRCPIRSSTGRGCR